MRDENSYNDVYLEDVKNNFEQAVVEDNVPLARDIVSDLRDAGFSKEAKVLERDLIDYQNQEALV